MHKKDIIKYLKDNRTWVLQHCIGVGGEGWWWLRNTEKTTETISVNGNSAHAASKVLNMVKGSWTESNFSA